MKLHLFTRMEDAEAFLKSYNINECMIKLTSTDDILVFVNETPTKKIIIKSRCITCPSCTKQIIESDDENSTYCPWCGEKLNVD